MNSSGCEKTIVFFVAPVTAFVVDATVHLLGALTDLQFTLGHVNELPACILPLTASAATQSMSSPWPISFQCGSSEVNAIACTCFELPACMSETCVDVVQHRYTSYLSCLGAFHAGEGREALEQLTQLLAVDFARTQIATN